MAIDAFLDFTKSNHSELKGESQDHQMKDMFHVHNCSFGIMQTGTAGTGSGLGAGKADLAPFTFTIDTQLGSPKLLRHCAKGTHFDKVILHCRKAGGEQEEFLTYYFFDVLISSYQTGISGESMDNVCLNFRGIFFEYTPQKNDGTLDTGKKDKGGWDVQKNKEITSDSGS